MAFISILVGLALLLAGRKLFWLAVATIGFIAGIKLTALYLEVPSESTLILISIAVGLLSALAAIVIQKIAVGLAGFLAGAYGAFIGMQKLGIDLGNLSWAPVLVFGMVGVILAALVFDWALILLSSLVGAYVIVSSFGWSFSVQGPVFVALSLIGVVIQAQSKKKKRPQKEKTADETK